MGSTATAIETTSSNPIPKVTLRQRAFIRGLVEGQSPTKAGENAGLANGREALEHLRDKLPSMLADVGLDPRSILCRLREKADATETKLFVIDGKIVEREVNDNRTQMDVLKTAAKMSSMLETDSRVNIGQVNIMWAGVPSWAAPVSAPVLNYNSASAVTIDNDSVHNGEGVPLSTIEGTGCERGGCAQTNSAQSESAAVISRPDEVAGTLLHRMQKRNRKRGRK